MRSVSRLNIGIALAAALCAAAAHAAPRKPAAARPSAAKPAPETVYVSQPSPAIRESRAPEPVAREPERRTEAAFSSGPLRDFPQAFGMYGGFYVAEVLGSNPYGTAFWEIYPRGLPFFFHFDLGIGTVQSSFSQDVVGGDIFENNMLLSVDALGGYSLSGLATGAGRGGGLFPYFIAGVTAFWQGGLPIIQESIPNIGGVIGFGNRMRLPAKWIGRDWAFNYVVRDNIYSQKIRTTPSLTQNFALLVGVQKYF